MIYCGMNKKQEMESVKLNILKICKSLSASLVLFFCAWIVPSTSFATHIVGGQLSYRCLDHAKFEVTLIVRRDCKNGDKDAYFDNPALIGIFYGDNQEAWRVYNGTYKMTLINDDTLSESINRWCIGPNDEVCVHQTIYKDTLTLPFDERGYKLVYQRCCRNKTLLNIEAPLNTGMTLEVDITAASLLNCNSGAVFGPFPPIYACVNTPITFNHSAVDLNNDSLVYRLCAPLTGKDSASPAGKTDFPPYLEVVWRGSFSLSNLTNDLGLPGTVLSIDPKTGIITGTPNIIGQFLVGVCVDEYRAGKIISSTHRDFELNIVPCGTRPTASFTKSTPACDGLRQSFSNTSTQSTNYEWYFDWNGNRNLKSTDQNPVFVYPGPGRYEVVLISYNGPCVDTATLTIDVIDPGLNANFNYVVDCKTNLILSLMDLSTTKDSIVSYSWKVTGGNNNFSSSVKNPIFVLSDDGRITIELTVKDRFGCTSVKTEIITVNNIDVELVPGPLNICSGDKVHLVKNPNPSYNYNWAPTTGLDLTIPSDPVASPNQNITYKVTISDANCSIERSIDVLVRGRVNLNVTGDTTLCDGKLELTASSDSTTVFKWSLNANFNPVLANGPKLNTTINGNTTIYVMAGKDDQCQLTREIHILDESVKLRYNPQIVMCAGDTQLFMITNLEPNVPLTIEWQSNPIIINGLNSLTPKIYVSTPGSYNIIYHAVNAHGCEKMDTIEVIAVLPPNPEFSVKNKCGELKIDVATSGNRTVSWDFGDGKGKSNLPVTSYTYEKSGTYIVTLVVDSVCTRTLSKEVKVVLIDDEIDEKHLVCFRDCIELNSTFNPNYVYRWTPADYLSDPNSPNPIFCGGKSTVYVVHISDPAFPFCEAEREVDIFVPEVLILGQDYKIPNDTTLCEKGPVDLNAEQINPNITLTWCDQYGKEIGKNPVRVNPDSTTFYILKTRDQNDCGNRDTVRVYLYELDAMITGPDDICKGDQAMLIVESNHASEYTYTWTPKEGIIGSDKEAKLTVKPDNTTTYEVEINNGKGCVWTLSHTIQVKDLSKEVFAKAEPEIIVAGVKSQLTTVNQSGYKYKWEPGDGLSATDIYNPLAMPEKTTTYTVTVTDALGCTATASVTVTVLNCEETVFVPNAFSPNADSHNDVLYVRSPFIRKMELVVTNRWGQEMFRTTEQTSGWRGDYKGEVLGPDVFGFCVRYTCPDNKEYTKLGNVTIIK